MIMPVLVTLVMLHTGDGQVVTVNPIQVTSLREAREDNKAFSGGVSCLINLTDGKFVTVVEDCATVRELIGDKRR